MPTRQDRRHNEKDGTREVNLSDFNSRIRPGRSSALAVTDYTRYMLCSLEGSILDKDNKTDTHRVG